MSITEAQYDASVNQSIEEFDNSFDELMIMIIDGSIRRREACGKDCNDPSTQELLTYMAAAEIFAKSKSIILKIKSNVENTPNHPLHQILTRHPDFDVDE